MTVMTVDRTGYESYLNAVQTELLSISPDVVEALEYDESYFNAVIIPFAMSSMLNCEDPAAVAQKIFDHVVIKEVSDTAYVSALYELNNEELQGLQYAIEQTIDGQHPEEFEEE